MPSPQEPLRSKPDIFAERYQRHRDGLSPAFIRVAAYIEANRLKALTLSAMALAREIGTSDATVVRAVKALGFDGLNDLRAELAATYRDDNAPAENLARTLADIGQDAEAAMDDALASLAESLDALGEPAMRVAMRTALKTLHIANRIAVFGIGPTAHIAAYFSARLRRKGRRTMLLNRTGADLADQLLELQHGDALLMLTYGEPYREAEATITEARAKRLPIVLLTDAANERLARQAVVVLKVPRGRSGRIALHGTTVACLEMLLLGLATSAQDTAIASLNELNRLRKITRPAQRTARTPMHGDDEQ